jgi:glucan biosynthesis protein C
VGLTREVVVALPSRGAVAREPDVTVALRRGAVARDPDATVVLAPRAGRPGAPRAGEVRYHYLDGLRSALMFTGVFVHAALGDDRVFRGIAHLSGLFRMNGFFLISGFFSSMLVLRYGPSLMVRRRLLSIGVPLLAVGTLCNPVAWWLMYNQYNPRIGFVDYLTGHGRLRHPLGPMTWHLQLWFLVSLLVYALATPPLFAAWRRVFTTGLFAAATATRARAMATLLGVLLALAAADETLYRVVLGPLFAATPADYVIQATLQYLPFFTVGMALFLGEQRLLGYFARPAPILFVVSLVPMALYTLHKVPALGTPFGAVLVRALFAFAVVANLFAIASRLIRREYPVLRHGADAAYSVYLFHYVTIYAIAALFGFGVNAAWPTHVPNVRASVGTRSSTPWNMPEKSRSAGSLS